MPDLEISKLPALSGSGLQATDPLAIADLSAAETKKITAKELIQNGFALTDAASLDPSKFNWTAVATGTIDGAAIANRTLPAVKLVLDSITAQEIAPNAIGASELADGAVDTAALQPKAVKAAQIADDTITALQIAPAAVGTSELLDLGVTTGKLADKGVTTGKIADLAVTAAQIVKGTITAAEIAADTITATQIAPDAITASELANGAVDTAAVINGAITNDKIAAGVDGAKLTDGTVTAAKIPASSLGRGLDKTSGAIGHVNAITASSRSGISYDAQGHITAAVALVPSDLPVATATAIGAASVPAGSGLVVSGVGALGHANTVAPNTRSGVSYDAQGHITAVVPLTPSDLPKATSSTLGVLSVPGPGLSIDAAGGLTHNSSGAVAGSYAKVTVDVRGHVTSGASLQPADIPAIDASKINSGTLDPARLRDRSVTQQKLADYALAYIQEAVPPSSINAHPIGMTWLQESTGQVSVWNGNSWMKTGASTLFNKNLRYGGSYNATTGAIMGVTQFGTAEGVKVGDQVPAADDKIAGLYFVAATAGTNSSFAGGAAMDAGDWLLCHGTTGGWVRIDTLNGAGGGGGGSAVGHLNDLLDVTLTVPSNGDFMQFNAAGQWVNVSSIDEGTWT